jgi:carbohydrate-binding DOMON domain-containing protein
MNWIARRVLAAALAGGLIGAMAAAAQEVIFTDPQGDDNGPGKYTYPTDPVFVPGAFDLTGFRLKAKGDKVDVEVNLAAKLTDPWKTGTGFSLQMIFIFIQTDPKAVQPAAAGAPAGTAGTKSGAATPAAGTAASAAPAAAGASSGAAAAANAPSTSSVAGAPATAKPGAKSAAKPTPKPVPGITQGLPGLNVQFAPEQAWDRCVILAPDPQRLRQEIEAKVPAAIRSAIIVPAHEKGSGHTISASFDRKALGLGNPKDWGFQVVVASYDPYPARESLLVRRVDLAESQYRFGGGSDADCDPNVLDILAGSGAGEAGEVEQQHQMLQYECKPGTAGRKLAALTMVHIKKELTREEKRAKKKEEEEKEREREKAKEGEAKPPGG